MGTGGCSFNPLRMRMIMVRGRRVGNVVDFFQGTGYHHFGFIAAVYTFTDLFNGFCVGIHGDPPAYLSFIPSKIAKLSLTFLYIRFDPQTQKDLSQASCLIYHY
jgi:hypothetical protein